MKFFPDHLISKDQKFGLKKLYFKIEKQVVGVFYSYDGEELNNSLRCIGINEGDTLLVHSSFKSNNGFKGTPKDIIECLLEVLGENGNLLMVSLPFTTSAYQYLKGNPIFDVNRTISKMGIISETFRRRKGVLRSLHPTHPVLAFGKDAAWIVKDHEISPFPCGEGTPFGKIRALKGKVLFLDVPFGNFTFIHYIEDLLKARISIPVYDEKLFPARVRNSLGKESVIPTYAFSDEIRKSRNPAILERALVRNGMLKAVRIGRTRLMLVGCEESVRCTNEFLDPKTFFFETMDQ